MCTVVIGACGIGVAPGRVWPKPPGADESNELVGYDLEYPHQVDTVALLARQCLTQVAVVDGAPAAARRG